MNELDELIAAPLVVRDHLARNVRERRLLQSLLRLSVKAAEYRKSDPARDAARTAPDVQGVAR